jgi:hypothetical protein
MATHKITEILDHLQKKVAALRQIYKSYPDTTVKEVSGGNELYFSTSINKDVDTIRFGFEKSWLYAYTSKTIGCIEINSSPEKFALLLYFPGDMFNQIIVQNYHDSMQKFEISSKLIRDCDLKILSFIKEKNIDLSKSNLNNSNESIRKLLSLL